ncbi:MAG: DUF2227 family putative metal-binding protein [Candidatus Bipolaricaulota bacterium]|nr:DUF2227 family putative metal-binding protein [Candidatus Bipolaricaulota bacterium]
MPSGRTHLAIETAVFVPCAAAGAYLWHIQALGWPEVATFSSSYLLSSLFLSPDLDLRRSGPSRRWGIARVLWLPYSGLFRHRRLSHHVLLGPLTRIVYLGILTALAAGAAYLLGGVPLSLSAPRVPLLIAGLVGVYLPNQLHALVDRFGSRWSRPARGRR